MLAYNRVHIPMHLFCCVVKFDNTAYTASGNVWAANIALLWETHRVLQVISLMRKCESNIWLYYSSTLGTFCMSIYGLKCFTEAWELYIIWGGGEIRQQAVDYTAVTMYIVP